MRVRILMLGAVLGLSLASGSARAAIGSGGSMQLSSPDALMLGPNHYTVATGQVFMVVISTDLMAQGGLGYMGADVTFDGDRFSRPPGDMVLPGSIVPDPAGFDGGVFGIAGVKGSYDQLLIDPPGPAIGSTGEFFKFQLEAGAVGSGSIFFNDAVAFDVAGNLISPTLGSGLLIEVTVPEPATSSLLLLTVGGMALFRRRR